MVYALAALQDGAPRVEVAYCLLERPAEPVAATFTQADAPALADALLRLARACSREEWPVAAAPAPRPVRRLPGPARRCARGRRR